MGMTDKYEVELTLKRDMLGTNPCDPNVLDTHIIQRQRKLIMEKNSMNTQINKYLDQFEITKEKGEAEVNALFAKLEELTGAKLTNKDREQALAGDLKSLKETFKELKLQGTTVFFWNDKKDKPMIGDHMIYGFMKAASEAICRTRTKKNGTILQSASYTQSIINQHVRCEDEFITCNKDVKRAKDGQAMYLQRSLRGMTPQGPRVSLAKSEVIEAGSKFKFKLKVMKGSPLKEENIKDIFDYGEITGLGQWRNSGKGLFSYDIKKLKN